MIKTKKIELELYCELNDDELLHKGKELARLKVRSNELTVEKLSIQNELKDAEAKIDKTATEIDQKQERRTVNCTEEYGSITKTVITRRDDTYERVDERDMTASEIRDFKEPDMFDDQYRRHENSESSQSLTDKSEEYNKSDDSEESSQASEDVPESTQEDEKDLNVEEITPDNAPDLSDSALMGDGDENDTNDLSDDALMVEKERYTEVA